MDCRLITIIGIRVSLRSYWGNDCTNHFGRAGSTGYHNGNNFVLDHLDETLNWRRVSMPPIGGEVSDYNDDEFPTVCEWCGATPAEGVEVEHQVSHKWLYNTASGKPEPGDMYYSPWHHSDDGFCHAGWENCTDPRGHLIVILPNGWQWDTDGRASNCTIIEDKTHRCWVKHGDPPNVHVDKDGFTCAAGAGSIVGGDYHGFLHHGKLVSC